MDNHTYQLIIKAFSVGNWLQTLLFYFSLGFMFNLILLQLKASPSSGMVSVPANEDEEMA